MSVILRYLRQDRGVAALEFALILPLLLAIIGGIVEFGRVIFAENAMRAAMDEYARHAVVRNLTAAQVGIALEDAVELVAGVDDYTVAVTETTCTIDVSITGTYRLILLAYLPEELQGGVDFSLTTRYPRC